jgi:hypothetical protein
MVVSGQLHAPPALSSGKAAPLSFELEAGGTLTSVGSVVYLFLSLFLVIQKRHYVTCLNYPARDGRAATLEGLVRTVHVPALFWSSTFLKITQNYTPPTDQVPYGIDF